ncbi:hypothetical protein BDY21DRAFT_397207 [Lineolata rhizophorae]|uniref:Uncharacterized protein n=1 Tax=Lineolata rhizophorae TaxID=578093 RepID=A0A6A6NUD8_9PEZI|nr:hypothetical protein BDY21DRAFT_397207 [Lineolata rhizophorae]
MFFKRLSRSRADSYVDDDYDGPPSANSTRYEKYDARPSSNRHSLSKDPAAAGPDKDASMYRRPDAPQDAYGGSPTLPRNNSGGLVNGQAGMPNTPGSGGGMGHGAIPPPGGMGDAGFMGSGGTPTKSPGSEPMMPDLLARAFSESVRPYTDKIEALEQQVAELQAWVESLQVQRAEVHAWIDKRGLRPDVPPSIAKQMDASQAAADTLNAQLDRKITIVNFDLHRLQDDLNDSISAAHFAAAMAKFLPDIARLSSLPGGPRYAFDLVLKLGGNLNSHGGLDGGDAADLAARRDFYAQLDDAMVDVVGRRFDEQEDWPVAREIKRIEKTAAYLRNFGVEPYFPRTLDVMRREGAVVGAGGAGGGGGYVGGGGEGVATGQGTPPRYH